MTITDPSQPLVVELATNPQLIKASQQLRYRVFAQEQGAQVQGMELGLDQDHYDDYSLHLLVRHRDTGEVLGSTRMLTYERARRAGSFYSENEFDLRGLMPLLQGNVIEIGRTCIHPDYRNGIGIAALWSGLAQFIQDQKIDYLFGCASVSMQDGGAQAAALMDQARKRYLSPEPLRVHPLVRLLPTTPAPVLNLPPLLKAYLKLGAWIAGEPCLDPDFHTADVFILLDIKRLNKRYQRHFTERNYLKNGAVPSLALAA